MRNVGQDTRDYAESRAATSDYLRGVARVLEHHAAAQGETVAVRDSRGQLTWDELTNEVRVLGATLESAGLSEGSPVLLLVDTCIETIVAYWAVRSVGGIAVIGDPGCTRSEFDQYVDAVQPGWVFTTRPDAWDRLSVESGRSVPSMRWFLQDHAIDGEMRPWIRRDSTGAAPKNRFTECPEVRVVLFSSGTTGSPKAIAHTEESVLALHNVNARGWALTPDDVVLGALPFHTIYGSIYTAASALHNGATLALMERFRPEVALERIESWGVTTTAMVPTMLMMMLNLEDKKRFNLESLRAVYVGAAPTSDGVMEEFSRFAGARVLATYGLTECPGAAVEKSVENHHPGTAGRTSPGFDAVARDETGKPLAPGITGEITVRGPTQMWGYLGQPELTQQRIRGGWVYTQDIGSVDKNGNVFVYGRASDMIIRGGLNIAPKEVEDVILQHPDVVAVAVIGVAHETYGQTVQAFVVPRDASTARGLRTSLKKHCASRLNRAKVPERFILVRDLPMNSGGKVVRQALTASGMEGRILYEIDDATAAHHDESAAGAATSPSHSEV